jgi:hypothetical protein
VTDDERILSELKTIRACLRWLIVQREIDRCGHDEKSQLERIALAHQLPVLPKDIIDRDKIADDIFRGLRQVRSESMWKKRDRIRREKEARTKKRRQLREG